MAEGGSVGHRRAIVWIRCALVPAVDERMTRDATIVIATKDRRAEGLPAVAQAASVEVLVLADGSSDGTSGAIREAYRRPSSSGSRSRVGVHLLRLGLNVRRLGLVLRTVFAGYRLAFAERHRREAVEPALYRVLRRPGYAPERLEAIEGVLPELSTASRAPVRVGA
jgi:hypothetical protein